ncbi:hypothetical protein COU61_03240 [Candidatus Pacearchaeota archaeon CG10_big_fil_rev_8_21_14_0_10_35_13]|nr:MAG: hypothetical protein COU61_03240 [Candidatus Pacearchaeota archaeon CG10_big_fil_rev_8_21_14_0_10_35_13]
MNLEEISWISISKSQNSDMRCVSCHDNVEEMMHHRQVGEKVGYKVERKYAVMRDSSGIVLGLADDYVNGNMSLGTLDEMVSPFLYNREHRGSE